MKAFPSNHDPKTGTMQLGMELRDYFAAQALKTICENKELTFEEIAVLSYRIADAMMLAREE